MHIEAEYNALTMLNGNPCYYYVIYSTIIDLVSSLLVNHVNKLLPNHVVLQFSLY